MAQNEYNLGKVLEQCRQSALYSAEKLGWHVISCSDGDVPRGIGEISDDIWNAVRGSLI